MLELAGGVLISNLLHYDLEVKLVNDKVKKIPKHENRYF